MIDLKISEENTRELLLAKKQDSSLCWGTGVIIFDRGTMRILLGQRTDDFNWGTPGGKVEFGESPFLSILRETVEESGVCLNSTKFFGVDFHSSCHHNWTSYFFFSDDYSGEPCDSDELINFKWVDVHDALELELFPIARTSIEKAIEEGLFDSEFSKQGWINFYECKSSGFEVSDSDRHSYSKVSNHFATNLGLSWD